MFGDDCGFIHVLYFKNPISSLFDPVRRKVDPTRLDKTATNSTQRIFWDVSLDDPELNFRQLNSSRN